jgi:branched-chain amino acid transport system substrate-binding protein
MVGRVLALVLAIGVLAAGCGSDAPSDGAESAQPESNGEQVDDGSGDSTGEQDVDGGSGAVSSAAPGEPIKIGDVSSYSGLDIFPEAATIARLVFKEYNEQGGVNGRPIQLVSVDDQDTAEGAASGARRLLEEEQVLGFCCGGSIVDCPNNAEYYANNGVEVVAGAAACIEAPTFHPVNTGPFVPSWHMFDFFHYDLGHDNICFTGYNIPLTEFFVGVIIPTWEQTTGLTVNVITVEPGEDLTPAVQKAKEDGCQAVEAAFTELNYQSYFQVVSDQGLLDDMDWGMLTSGYSLSLLDSAGENLQGVYVNSEYEPFTGDPDDHTEDVREYLALTEEVGLLPTSFGQGGWLAAKIIIAALESIEGEINFDSVQEAIRNVEVPNSIMGDTFTASGYVNGSQPNTNSKIVQVVGDDFIPITDWRTFPLNAADQ